MTGSACTHKWHNTASRVSRKPCPECGMKPYRANEAGIVYDREVSIAVIHIRRRKRGEKSAYTREVAHGWVVDFDKAGNPIDIEVLLPSKSFPKEVLALLPPEFVDYPATKR